MATSLLGVLTIILGAFGAHSLKEVLSDNLHKSFETAVRYQMYHVLALLFINTTNSISLTFQKRISTLFFIGITLFSGSIYMMTIFHVPAKSIWFVTPLGGLFLIAGWATLCLNFIKNHKS
mgnify:CR=1 FL=1